MISPVTDSETKKKYGLDNLIQENLILLFYFIIEV